MERSELSRDFRPVKIEKTIRGLKQIDPEVQAFGNLLETAGFKQGDANLELAFGEALGNAWEHGNEKDDTKDIKFTIEIYAPDKLRFSVQDQGAGFVMDEVPDSTTPENKMKDGGRGFTIMRAYGSANYDNVTKTLSFEFPKTDSESGTDASGT